MLYREIIAVCAETHTKHINTLCGRNVELLHVDRDGSCVPEGRNGMALDCLRSAANWIAPYYRVFVEHMIDSSRSMLVHYSIFIALRLRWKHFDLSKRREVFILRYSVSCHKTEY